MPIAWKKVYQKFFVVSKWKLQFWLVYIGFVCGGSTAEIILLNVEERVTDTVPYLYRIIVCIGLIVWNILTIPYNSPIAKFATANFKNLYDK